MRLGVSLEPPPWPRDDHRLILRTARQAEDVGLHHVLMSSHVLENQNGSAMDPVVLLSAVAGGTSRIGIATSVLVLPYYEPVVLANQIATLDVLSGGRFVLSVGTGWNPEEFAALGVPLRERGARTDDHLRAMKALWSGEPADHQGRFTSFRQARIGVRPYTPGGPRVWVGGHSDAALRRALRLGDGWHGVGLSSQGVSQVRQRLRTLGAEVGRDPDTLELSSVLFLVPPGLEQVRPTPGALLGGPRATTASVLAELGELAEAGISMCSLWMPVPAERMADALEWLGREIVPHLAAMATATSRSDSPSPVS